MSNKRTVKSIVGKIGKNNTDYAEENLQTVVEEILTSRISDIRKGGLEAQVAFLLDEGSTKADILGLAVPPTEPCEADSE